MHMKAMNVDGTRKITKVMWEPVSIVGLEVVGGRVVGEDVEEVGDGVPAC